MTSSWRPSSPPPVCRDGWSPGPAWNGASPRRKPRGMTVVTGPPGAGETNGPGVVEFSASTTTRARCLGDSGRLRQPAGQLLVTRSEGAAADWRFPGGDAAGPHRMPGRVDTPSCPSWPRPWPRSTRLSYLVLDDLHLLTAPKPLAELAYVLQICAAGPAPGGGGPDRPALPAAPAPARRGADRDPRCRPGLHRRRSRRADGPARGLALPAGAVNLITERVGGWAAGLRLAALSLDGHPDPGLFIKNLAAEDNALTSYLVDEVLDAQPPAQPELMLQNSILDQVSADVAGELTGDGGARPHPGRAGQIRRVRPAARPRLVPLPSLAGRGAAPEAAAGDPRPHARPASAGRSRWLQKRGLEKAVAHAAAVNNWPLAARMVVDELAMGEVLKPRGSSPVAAMLRRMPSPRRTFRRLGSATISAGGRRPSAL